jgi:hypothetical protein
MRDARSELFQRTAAPLFAHIQAPENKNSLHISSKDRFRRARPQSARTRLRHPLPPGTDRPLMVAGYARVRLYEEKCAPTPPHLHIRIHGTDSMYPWLRITSALHHDLSEPTKPQRSPLRIPAMEALIPIGFVGRHHHRISVRIPSSNARGRWKGRSLIGGVSANHGPDDVEPAQPYVSFNRERFVEETLEATRCAPWSSLRLLCTHAGPREGERRPPDRSAGRADRILPSSRIQSTYRPSYAESASDFEVGHFAGREKQ